MHTSVEFADCLHSSDLTFACETRDVKSILKGVSDSIKYFFWIEAITQFNWDSMQYYYMFLLVNGIAFNR